MWAGSCLSSPRSTFLTMSTSRSLARAVSPTFSPSRTTKPFRYSISVRRPLAMSWPIDGRCSGRTAALRRDPVLVARQRLGVALAGAGDDLRRQVVDLFEPVAECLADADRLAAEPRLESPDALVLRHLCAGQPGRGRDPVRHRVGDELRPALAPQIVGRLGAVGDRDEAQHLLGTLGH